MRNGNLSFREGKLIFEVSVFILPMRNGNLNFWPVHFLISFCFYLTYEEWKRFSNRGSGKYNNVFILPMRNGNFNIISYAPSTTQSFYLTYEEWKLNVSFPKCVSYFSFYLTYEEWKPDPPSNFARFKQVFILPMRNGNLSSMDAGPPTGPVFILPMRNGNFIR